MNYIELQDISALDVWFTEQNKSRVEMLVANFCQLVRLT